METGKKEVPVEEVSEETEIAETEQPNTENSTETLKTQLKELTEAKTKAEAEAKRLEEGYKGLQSKYNKTYEESKRVADLHTEVGDLKKYIKILAAQQVAMSREDPDGLNPDKQQEYLKKFEEMEREAEQRRKEADLKVKQEEQFKRFDEVWTEAQKYGTAETNDSVADIYDALVEQKLYKAERILNKLTASKKETTVVEVKKETDDEIFERIAKAKGLLKTDSAVPSGKTSSFEDAEARFAEGEISLADYQEARKKAGIY